jgi:FMN phosphatase YigB (HAD superfamily)
MNNKVFLVDFDHTLANVDEFKKDFLEVFNRHSIDANEVRELYKRNSVKIKRGEYLFSIDKLLDELIQEELLDPALSLDIKFEIKALIGQFFKYIPETSKQFLRYLNDRGHQIIIFSYGDKYHQELKIRNSGILEINPAIRLEIVENYKRKYLKENKKMFHQKGFHHYLVNDNLRENLRIGEWIRRESIPMTIMAVAPIAKNDSSIYLSKAYKENKILFFENLEAVKQYLETL